MGEVLYGTTQTVMVWLCGCLECDQLVQWFSVWKAKKSAYRFYFWIVERDKSSLRVELGTCRRGSDFSWEWFGDVSRSARLADRSKEHKIGYRVVQLFRDRETKGLVIGRWQNVRLGERKSVEC